MRSNMYVFAPSYARYTLDEAIKHLSFGNCNSNTEEMGEI